MPDVIDAGAHRLHEVFAVPGPGGHDDLRAGVGSNDLREQLQTLGNRAVGGKHEVEQDHGVGRGFDLRSGPGAIAGLVDDESRVLQNRAVYLAKGGVVLDEQDLSASVTHGRLWCRLLWTREQGREPLWAG